VTGVALLQFLETRLDNVVYRMGFAPSRKEARQLVLHGHFTVNGRKAAVPSYGLKPGDEVAVSTASRRSPYFAELARTLASSRVPEWLQVEPDNLTGRVTTLPSRQQIDTPLQEQLIVEYYSR
jgi:small subunit ribosomal protein S4